MKQKKSLLFSLCALAGLAAVVTSTSAYASRPYSYVDVYYDGPDFANSVGYTIYPCAGSGRTFGTVTEYIIEEDAQACHSGGFECPDPDAPCF